MAVGKLRQQRLERLTHLRPIGLGRVDLAAKKHGILADLRVGLIGAAGGRGFVVQHFVGQLRGTAVVFRIQRPLGQADTLRRPRTGFADTRLRKRSNSRFASSGLSSSCNAHAHW